MSTPLSKDMNRYLEHVQEHLRKKNPKEIRALYEGKTPAPGLKRGWFSQELDVVQSDWHPPTSRVEILFAVKHWAGRLGIVFRLSYAAL